MDGKVSIIGGFSLTGQISIMSDMYCSTARYRNNQLECNVKELGLLKRMMQPYRSLFAPRIFRLLAVLSKICTWKDAMQFVLMEAACMLLSYMSKNDPASVNRYGILIVCVFALFPISMFAYIRFRIAKFHAAEHMAIAAYENDGSTELDRIANASRIHGKCGTRFLLPMAVVIVASACVSAVLSSGFLQVQFVFLAVLALGTELLLRLEERWGLDNLPLCSQISNFLQRYLVTDAPGESELLIAQKAMRCLLERHAQS